METYKILSNMYDSDVSGFLTMSEEGRTRGHAFKLFKQRAHLNMRKYSFSYRIVDQWNALPSEVVNAPTLNCFKNRLDRHLSNQPIIYDFTANITNITSQDTRNYDIFNFDLQGKAQ